MRKLTIEEMRQLASQRDGKCLSVVYESNYIDLEWECEKGHRWFALPKAVKQGHWCKRCVVNSRKKSIEAMYVLAKKKGGKCLSTQYGSSKTKLLWECKKGHQWDATPNAIQKGTWCPLCSGLQKQSIEDMHVLAKKKGGKCLSTQYVNSRTHLLWECRKGHQWHATPGDIVQNHWCPHCSGRAPLTLPQMQESASQRNGKFLSETFTRVKDLHRWQCAKGHTFQMKPNTVRSGSWCPHCAGKVVTYNDMVQMAQRKGGKFVSQEYRGNAVKHDWECCEGHQWKMVPNAVQQGQWCPRCSKKLTERIVRVHFEQLFGKSFPTVKPKWLVNIRGNRMELDGYCETLNLAFEYHGFQHYQYKHFFHRTEKGFQDRKTNDVLKQKICKSKGVNLIEIPYTIQPDELKTFILSECKQLHILISSKQKGMKIDCRESYSSRDLERYQAIAARHGGVCLSPHYVNAHTKLWWQCKQGHQWLMKPNQIQQGCWCVKCKGLGIYKRPF